MMEVKPVLVNCFNDPSYNQIILNEFPFAVAVLEKMPNRWYDAIDLLKYNRNHKKGGLYIRSCKQYLEQALSTDHLLNEFATHDFDSCKDCRRDNLISPRKKQEKEEEEVRQENVSVRLKSGINGKRTCWKPIRGGNPLLAIYPASGRIWARVG